jgi:tetratricopeptide (TPR) repeat protein
MRNSTYDQFIYAGTLHLGHGDFKAARNYFNMATSYARNHGHTHDEACAEQLSGIALRLAGQYYRSETAFVRALMLALEASDEGLAARIHRDWAMLLMDQGMFAGANDRLIESLAKLRADNVEYWVTRGFIGRVNLLLGRRELAAVIIAEADRHLIDADNRNYELDTLVWWMRASTTVRFKAVHRAWKLAQLTEQSRRKAEIVVIALGGNTGYRLAKRLSRALSRIKQRLS